MIQVWQRIESVMIAIVLAGVLSGALVGIGTTVLPTALVLLLVAAVASLNENQKRIQLLAWEGAYAEWAALHDHAPSDGDVRRDLFADARKVFAIAPEDMTRRWWESSIEGHVRDARTWNEVLAWMRRQVPGGAGSTEVLPEAR